MNAQTPKSNREEVLREKRGQGLAARDLVKRECDHFTVIVPSLRTKRPDVYEVSRAAQGRVRCTCLQFASESKTNPNFRCEHIYAVRAAQAKKEAEEAKAQARGDDQQPFAGRGKREREIEAQLNSPPVETRQPSENIVDEASSVTRPSAIKPSPAIASKLGQVIPLEFVNTLRALRQPVDPKLVKTREGWTDRRGNKHAVEYVEWHTVADILDRTCPAWSHAVKSVAQIGDVVAVSAAITIDGVTREGVGTGAADSETSIKKAEHDALKRAAVKFGIARELYQREAEIVESADAGRADGSHAARFVNRRGDDKSKGFDAFPPDPIAKGTADLVTPKQLGMIRALAREAGVSAERECLSLLGCKTEDLSKRAASSLIDYLKAYPESADVAARQAG